jgi:hypothetical protein
MIDLYSMLSGARPAPISAVRVNLGIAPIRESPGTKRQRAARKRKILTIAEQRAKRMHETAARRAGKGKPKRLHTLTGIGAASESVAALLASLGGYARSSEVAGYLGLTTADLRFAALFLVRSGRMGSTGQGKTALWWLIN